MTISDARYSALVTQGFTGQTNQMLLAWLQGSGATSDQLTDAWGEMLTAQGFAGHRNDEWFALLGSLGNTGALSDRELEFWESGGIIAGISDEVQLVFDRMPALDQTEMDAIEAFVDGMVADGIYANITEIYAPCLNGSDFLTGFKFMTAVVSENVPVHTPGEYIDFQNTAQHWLDEFNLDTFSTLDGFMGAYISFNQADSATNSDIFGVEDGTQACFLRWRGTGQNNFNSLYNVTANTPRSAAVNRPDNDFIGFGLNGTTIIDLQPGGLTFTETRIRNATVPKVDCQWHGHNQNGIPANGNMTNCKYSLMLHSNIISEADIGGALRTRCLQFLRDIGVSNLPGGFDDGFDGGFE